MKNTPFIPVCEPTLRGREEEYVIDALRSTWIGSGGKYLDRLHTEFPDYLGSKFGTSTTNGTTALHLALLALGIKAGDEVILPDYTMIASAFAICYTGAKPVFVDCRRDSWNINIDLIEENITKKTKAIMVVHLYGLPCEMDSIIELAGKYDLLIIEDAAEAHGSEFKGKKCGTFGDIAAFSFYSNKNITSGEGGFVVSNNEGIYKECLYYKNLCFPLDKGRVYQHDHIGYNFRMTNLQAAIALAQLERIEDLITCRRENAYLYNKNLKELEGITLPIEPEGYKNTYWMYSILIEDEFGPDRDEVMTALRQNNIDSRPFFIPMHRQKSLADFGCRDTGVVADEKFPVSCDISKRGLYLPSSSHLTKEQIQYICETVSKIKKTY